MKKLFYILLFSALAFSAYSCGSDDDDDNYDKPTNNEEVLEFDDWNDKKSPNYKPEGYNPIEGVWYAEFLAPEPIFKMEFTKDFRILCSSLQKDGKWSEPHDTGTYKINDKTYKDVKENSIVEWAITEQGGVKLLSLNHSASLLYKK